MWSITGTEKGYKFQRTLCICHCGAGKKIHMLKKAHLFFYYIPDKLYIKALLFKCIKEKDSTCWYRNKHCSVSYVMDSGFAKHLRFHILCLLVHDLTRQSFCLITSPLKLYGSSFSGKHLHSAHLCTSWHQFWWQHNIPVFPLQPCHPPSWTSTVLTVRLLLTREQGDRVETSFPLAASH